MESLIRHVPCTERYNIDFFCSIGKLGRECERNFRYFLVDSVDVVAHVFGFLHQNIEF